MINHNKIAILSTVINFDLYQKSMQFFPQGIQKYVIDGTNGMYGMDSICYMMKKLKGKGIEWLVMADEDVLFVNPDGIFTIIEEMKANNYMVSGVRDGGAISIRKFSPFVLNTFFSIINFKELESIWDEKEVMKHQYITENEFAEDLTTLHGEYDVKSIYEPYYRFYFWLRRQKKKILFLEASIPLLDDQSTTLVCDTSGEPLLYHTWYARSYGVNEMHTKRIDKVFALLKPENGSVEKPIIFKHKTFYTMLKAKKLLKRISMKMEVITQSKSK